MNNFRESYQQMMNDMPAYSIDVDSVLNEARHKHVIARQRKQMAGSVVLTLCLLCICGVGSVKAAGYFGNVIRATNTGFATGDAVTMSDMARGSEEAMESEESGMETEEEAIPGRGRSAVQETTADEWEDQSGERQKEVLELESVMIESREYTSVADFRSAEPDAVLVLPDMPEDESEIEELNISVMEDTILFHCITKEGRAVTLHVSNYVNSQGHASSVVYGDEIVNEREYITQDGYTYTLIDSVNEEQIYCGLHAAAAVGSYEIIADFWGYSEEEALSMIEGMDLTSYLATSYIGDN